MFIFSSFLSINSVQRTTVYNINKQYNKNKCLRALSNLIKYRENFAEYILSLHQTR